MINIKCHFVTEYTYVYVPGHLPGLCTTWCRPSSSSWTSSSPMPSCSWSWPLTSGSSSRSSWAPWLAGMCAMQWPRAMTCLRCWGPRSGGTCRERVLPRSGRALRYSPGSWREVCGTGSLLSSHQGAGALREGKPGLKGNPLPGMSSMTITTWAEQRRVYSSWPLCETIQHDFSITDGWWS